MNLNLVGLAENIARVYEIATLGSFNVKLIPGEDACVTQDDIDLLNEFYDFDTNNAPDMVIQVWYTADQIMNLLRPNKSWETIGDINERIEDCRNSAIEVSEELNSANQSLLKTAISRLGLGVHDVITIIGIAKVIAKMAASKTIKVEHLAEAIQYKSIKPEEI